MSRILGSKMAAKMAILAIEKAKMNQDGAQDIAKLSQDGIWCSEFLVFTSCLILVRVVFELICCISQKKLWVLKVWRSSNLKVGVGRYKP